MEGDSLCAIRWASGSSNQPWHLANLCDEVTVLVSKFEVSFNHIKRSANVAIGALTKLGVGSDDLVIDYCISLAK